MFIIIPGNMRTGFVLVVLSLGCAGCVHHNTSAQRNASFSPYRDARIGEENLGEYLSNRSAALIIAERLDTSSLRTNSFTFRNSSTNEWRGTATPIDTRGYFLTAAHCVEKGPFWLVFPQGDKLRVERARLVWRGDKTEGRVDLAILCVSVPITQTFEWATELTNGSPVVDLGWSLEEQSGQLEPQWMGGRILKVSEGL